MTTLPVAIEVSVTPPEGQFADGYRYYLRAVGEDEWVPLTSSDEARVRIDGMPSTGTYELGIAPVVAGIEASEEAWTVEPWRPTPDDFTAPADVEGFAAQQAGPMVLLRWNPVAIPYLEHYEIRLGASWDDGIKVADVREPATSTQVGAWYTGTNTYWIAAWTSQGLRSASPVSAVVSVEVDDYAPVQGTVDESGGGFTATKSATEVSGSDLIIQAMPVDAVDWTADGGTYTEAWYLPHRGTGTYTTAWVDVGAVVRERVEVNLSAAMDSTSPDAGDCYFDADAGDYLTPALYDTRGLQIKVEIDTAQDGVPTSDGWRVWVPGSTYKYRQVRLRITLVSLSPRNLKLSTLSWRRRRLNRKDEVTATVVGTGGTAVSFSTGFTVAPQVSAQYVGTSGYFATADSVTTTGCNVRIFSHDGTEIGSGTVHVQALGV